MIANASYLSGLSGGNTIVAEWTGTEGTYSTALTSSYTGSIYFKMIKSGLASNVHNTNTTLTSDPAVTTLSGSSQTGGDVSTDPSATSLGAYGSGRTAGGAQDSDTKLLLNFDRGGGTDIEDSSNRGGDGHKVTANGNAAIKASPFGDGKTAIYFDGSDDSLSVASTIDTELDAIGTGAFTVEFWVNFSNVTSEEGLFNFSIAGNNNSAGLQIAYRGDYSPKGFNVMVAGTQKTVNFDAKIGRWYHLAMTRSASGGTVRFFIDGENKPENGSGSGGAASGTGSLSWTASGTLDIAWAQRFIGRLAHSSGLFFNGYIDEFRVSNIERYTTNFDVSTSRFTNDSNTKLLIHSNDYEDASDSHHRVSLVNSAEYSTSGTLSWSESHYNLIAARYLKVENHGGETFKVPASTPFCLEGWFKSNSAQSQHAGIFGLNDDNNNCLMIMFSSGNTVRLYMNDGGQMADLTTSSAVNNNTWYHVAAVRQSDNAIKFYLDGALVGTSSNTLSARSVEIKMDGGDPWFHAGTRQYTGTNFDGYAQDIRLVIGSQVYSGAFTKPNGPLTTTGGSYSDTTNVDTSITSGHCKLLLSGDQGTFDDSSTSNHTITPTGSYHTYDNVGIAPALTWPASGKLKGTSGIYLDGDGDYLEIPYSANLNYGVANQALSIDMWIHPTEGSVNGHCLYMQGTDSNNRTLIFYYGNNNGIIQVYTRHGGTERINVDTSSGTNTPISLNRWNHIAVTRDTSGVHRIYINGKYQVKATDNTSNALTSNHFISKHSYASQAYFRGYIDNVRFQKGVVLYSGANQESTTNAYTVPTRAYGAYGTETPDVGTITLTATGDGDFTWSEVAGGTALPGTLAVGSTTHSGSGNSRTHTATITGTLPTFTGSTFTNGTRSDIATNNILLKVQHDTDATKAITLNGATGVGITQKSTEKPVLFGGRRWHGNGVAGRRINGLGFQPDLLIGKDRDDTNWWLWVDSVRGAHNANAKVIYSNSNVANDNPSGGDTFSAFNKDGFEIGANTRINDASRAFSAWAFKAGGNPVSISATQASSVTQSASSTTGLSITK